jgi:hypothetical protein
LQDATDFSTQCKLVGGYIYFPTIYFLKARSLILEVVVAFSAGTSISYMVSQLALGRLYSE